MLAGQCQGREERAWPAQDRPVRLDAAWLCKLAGRGMLRPSFVPSPWQRDLCCYRRILIQERTREKQRAGKLPEDAQLTELPDRIVVSGGLASARGLGSLLVINERDGARDLSSLRVLRCGAVEATGDPFEPYQVVDVDGVVVAPAAAYLKDLQACGRPAGCRSATMPRHWPRPRCGT